MPAEAGADIREHDRVESVDDLDAEHVVVATDGYPSGLLGDFESLIIPTRGQMIATEPLPEQLFPCPHYARHGFDYWQQTPDGRLLAGGFRDVSLLDGADDRGGDDSRHPGCAGTTRRRPRRPAAGGDAPVGGPVRPRARLPAGRRAASPASDDVWVAGGYSGHGNVLGFMCGRLVASTILGRKAPEVALFDPARLL